MKSPLQLGDYELPEGAAVTPSIYLLHRNEESFPEASRFISERFCARDHSPFEFIPFGGGHRRCLGDTLALMEMERVLSTLLRTSTISVHTTQQVSPRRRGIALAPECVIQMSLE